MLLDPENKSPSGGHGRHAVDGQHNSATAGRRDLNMEATIAQIRYWHRLRSYHMVQRIRADQSLGAFLKIALGWSKALPDAERKRIAAQAQSLVDFGEAEAKGKASDSDEPAYFEWRETILATIQSRAPHDAVESRAKKEMGRLAESLPAWHQFGEGVRGFGAVSLAKIVGEAGDLSRYPKHGHLWKRMGLAVMGDVRQGGLTKGALKADWIEHGYSPMRRSQMFSIGEALVKQGDHYRQIYLARKLYERTRAEAAGLTIAPSAKIPKARVAEFMSDGHVHRRAQRYMEKRLLRDLWRAWRDVTGSATQRVPHDVASPELPTPLRATAGTAA